MRAIPDAVLMLQLFKVAECCFLANIAAGKDDLRSIFGTWMDPQPCSPEVEVLLGDGGALASVSIDAVSTAYAVRVERALPW
jgi:hypothetical protein